MSLPSSIQLVRAFAEALALEQGFYSHEGLPTTSQRNYNPGELRSWCKPDGLPYPDEDGVVTFPKCDKSSCRDQDHPSEVGWQACRAQIKINVFKRNLTFREFFCGKQWVYSGYVAAKERGDPELYAENVCAYVCERLGYVPRVDVDTVVSTMCTPPPARAPR